MKALIGGGSGFVGKQVKKTLEKSGYSVLVISRSQEKGRLTWKDIERTGLPSDTSAVINFAGENLMNPAKRWNAEFISELRSSRINTTRLLASAISASPAKSRPSVWLSASGVGYYPSDADIVYNEDSQVKLDPSNVLQQLCVDWEAAATLSPEASAQCRSVILRLGVVLGRTGGMIQQIYLPYSLGLGGRIGSGEQTFPWIHIADVCGIVLHALKNNDVNGVLNGTAPSIVTNAVFTKEFGRALNRPAMIPIPEFVFNTIYGTERAKSVLEGPKVVPKRTVQSGYKFIHPDVRSACDALVKEK